MFLSMRCSIVWSVWFLLQSVHKRSDREGQTVRTEVTDGPHQSSWVATFLVVSVVIFGQSELLCQRVHKVRTDSLWGVNRLSMRGKLGCRASCGYVGKYGQSVLDPRTVRAGATNFPYLPGGRSIPVDVDCLSASLLKLCFRFGLSWDLFIGLVSLLWLRDLWKLVWISLELISGHSPVHLFGEEFLSALIHSPLFSCLINPSHSYLGYSTGFWDGEWDSFSENEITKALFQIEHNKSPKLDGFLVEFYQHVWDIIKSNLLALFNEFHQGILPLRCLNFDVISLLPKKLKPSWFSNIGSFVCWMYVLKFLQRFSLKELIL
jgi:hypothetical protein